MARRVAKEEGILLGSSGGLAVAAALKLAPSLAADDLVVVLIPDSGRGYLSRVYNDEWMANYGFLRECDLCVAAILDVRGKALPPLLYVNPSHTVRQAIDLMRSNGISQLPVCKNEPPFAAAEISGAVDELELMDAVFRDPSAMEVPVEKVMGPRMPTVGIGQAVSKVVEMMQHHPALVVLSGGQPVSVITRTDVLRFLELSDG